MSKPHSKACKCFYCEQQRKPPEQPPEVPCAQCGKPVEKERHVYAIPTCYACLPPPATLPEVPAPGDSADLEAIRRCLEAYGPHSLREAARTLLRMVDELTETVHRLSSGWDTERDELTANRDEAVRGCKDWEKAYRKMEDEMRAKLAEAENGLIEARLAARVIAHSWDHDSRPPDGALAIARTFDSRGGKP